MLDRVAAMGDRLPPRLKALLNLTISVVLALMCVPFLWSGVVERSLADLSFGLGMALLAVFNLFT